MFANPIGGDDVLLLDQRAHEFVFDDGRSFAEPPVSAVNKSGHALGMPQAERSLG